MMNFKKILAPNGFKCISCTILLVSCFLFLLFKDLILAINSTYFSTDINSIKTYYSILYHVRFDESLFRTTALNYPYGEMLFFTDSQAPLANAIKLISHYFFDISGYTVGIINAVLLLSFVVSAVCIFLILRELNLNLWYSSYVSVALPFLSPQVVNLSEHFSLSYGFILPLAIWLLMVFYRRPTFFKSIAIALLTFVSSAIHLYYFSFLSILLLVCWGYKIGFEKEGIRKTSLKLIHFFIQLVLPYLALQTVLNLNDSVSDRSTHPFGMLEHRTQLSSLFFPSPMGFIGFVAVLGMLCLSGLWLKRIVQTRGKECLHFTDNLQLNLLFWTSFLMLLYALGLPYIWGLEWILNYVGFLRHIRDIGRLAWLFFYVMNIVSFYALWTYPKRFKSLLISLALLIVACDAFFNVRMIPYSFSPPILTQTPENEWLNKINAENYQAIITLPYFHEGSENVWYTTDNEAVLSTFITSLSTGLPAMGSLYSRTSIRQTLDNLQVSLEPYRNLAFLSKCRTKKPFLLLVSSNFPKTNLKFPNLKLVYEFRRFNLYELPYRSLKSIADGLFQQTLNEMNTLHLYKHKNVYSSDSLANFVYNDFYGSLSNNAYMGVDAFEGLGEKSNTFFRGTLPHCDTNQTYIASFWLGGIERDLCSRSLLKIRLLDKNGNAYQSEICSVFRWYQTLDKNWGLVEYPFKFRHCDDILELKIQNQEMTHEKLYIDQLLIRPITTTIFVKLPEYIGKNNRYFKIE